MTTEPEITASSPSPAQDIPELPPAPEPPPGAAPSGIAPQAVSFVFNIAEDPESQYLIALNNLLKAFSSACGKEAVARTLRYAYGRHVGEGELPY